MATRAFALSTAVTLMVLGLSAPAAAQLRILDVRPTPTESVAQHQKLEIAFGMAGSRATNMQWPYDPAPPNGVPPRTGITVNGVFTDPSGAQYRQPAFFAQQYLDGVRQGRDWHLPTGVFQWVVRFSPHVPGAWSFKIEATDASGSAASPAYPFVVTASESRGLVRVSARDSRYFEFADGSLFQGRGFALPSFIDNPVTQGAPEYQRLASNGVDFVRVWISSMFGAAWNSWIGGRNQYGGYLPIDGLTPYTDPVTGRTSLTMRLDYEGEGDTGWFDACRMQIWWEDRAESIKPNTTYRIRVRYSGSGITGPRNSAYPRFGLVAKIGGWHPNCYEPGTSTAVTSYGGNTSGFGSIDGAWFSGADNFLPRMYLAVENVREGTAWIDSVSLREDLGGGQLGPEMMIEPSMEREHYIPDEKAYSLDRVIESAERAGVYLKLVVMDKQDTIYSKIEDDGSWVTTVDNRDGFYGLGRGMNKTRWLQQMWWRYLQARWGYSPAVHSWELINEGDPVLTRHYEVADEFGKFMHCRVFGVEPGAGDNARCSLRHPNAHLVTTSFWHSFPVVQFWMNAKYPNVDYADLHAYVSTSYAPLADRQLMQYDESYFHTWHSQDVARWRPGKPVVRGEAGLDSPNKQSETALGLDRNRTGVWLHNYLWAGLHAGGMYELYWWSRHIWNQAVDFRPSYQAVRRFMADVPLNHGGYVDWGGSVSNSAIRVVGQKNTAAGALHLWVQNRQHTWKNVADGVAIAPVSGQIVIPGFQAGKDYTLERWDTYAVGGRVTATEQVVADAAGNLSIGISGLATDVGLKIISRSAARRAPKSGRIVPRQ